MKTTVRPVMPGKLLRRILAVHKITQDQLANASRLSRFSINQIINGRRKITVSTAVRLSLVLGTTPDIWLNLQRDVDLFDAQQCKRPKIKQLVNAGIAL